MGFVNHLRAKDGQNLFHAVAYGKHAAMGNLTKSKITGSSPTHVITVQQMLGRGEWDACEGLWWNGVEIKSDKYKFYPGIQSPGMGDATQGQDAVFDTDTPHSGVAWMRAELTSGLGEFDTEANPPEGLKGIFRTMKVNDYDSAGDVDGYAYSTSAARQVADLILRIGNRPNSRIDWGAWVDWRDFMLEDIGFDYAALPDFDGFGLTAKLYNGTAFDTLVTERIDPVLEFASSAGSPGAGVDVDNFSVRWEGTIKAKYSETYTFYVTHTHGAKVWVNDVVTTPLIDEWSSTGTHSATIALTAGTHYNIKVEWKHTTGSAAFKLEWQSTSQSREVISHRALYPKAVNRPRYETHPFFPGPTRLDDAVRTVLNLCNSTMQEVNGKLRFFCLEQMSSSFHFTNDMIVDGSLSIVPRDVRNLRNTWQARFRDVDSQYLEFPIDPMLIERPDLIEVAGRKIDGDSIELYNCSVHQAYRTLDNIVRRNVDSKYQFNLTGMANTFPVLAGDRVGIDVEFLDWEGKDGLVLESNDSSSEETADERTFVVQEWPDFPTYTPLLVEEEA